MLCDESTERKRRKTMELTKGQTLLYLYTKLEKEKVLSKKAAMELTGLSNVTFKRYMNEIRCFLRAFEPTTEINYLRKKDLYVLVKNR